MKNSFKLRNLSIAALVGLASMGVAQAQDTTTTITTTLADGTEHSLELQTTYGEGNTSVTTNYTVLGQEVPYTYKFDNLYGDENGDTSITTDATVLGQPVTFTYKYQNPETKTYSTTYENYSYDYGTVTNPSGTSSSAPYQMVGESALNNLEGNSIEIDNTLFLNNSVVGKIKSSTSGYKYASILGSTIYNAGEITKITADFIGNSVSGSASVTSMINANGGAIYNDSGTIFNISGAFVKNYAKGIAEANANGGAIYNDSGSIGDINADFIGNYVQTIYGDAAGGAIYNNSGTIGNITGDFIANKVTKSSSTNEVLGGAIYNKDGFIGNIIGNFIGNYTSSSGAVASVNVYGGAIYNDSGSIGDINADFVGNYAEATVSSGYGGAIYNATSYKSTNIAEINSLNGDFVQNYVKAYQSAYGGAIYNNGTISNITGDFIGNYAESISTSSSATAAYRALGGAIYNYADYKNTSTRIGNITGDFVGNYVKTSSAASYSVEASGGAIYNNGTIGDITGDFIDNHAESTSGPKAIVRGGAICNEGTIGNITGNFANNYLVISSSNSSFGGAIYNVGAIRSDDSSGKFDGGLINSSFYNNYIKATNGTANGGAIYTTTGLNIIAKDNWTSVISGNYVEDKDGKRPEGIFIYGGGEYYRTDLGEQYINGGASLQNVTEASAKENDLNLIVNTNGKIIVDDQIVSSGIGEYTIGKYYMYDTMSSSGYVAKYLDDNYNEIDGPEIVTISTANLNITGDGTGLVQLNNDVINLDITLDNSTLHLGLRDNVLDNNNLTLNSGTLSMINNQVGVSALNSLTVSGDTNVLVDVDLANQTMDRFTASEYGSHSGNLNVTGMNLLSDSVNDTTEILFAEQGLKDNVTNGITSQLPDDTYQTTLFTPIYKYDVSYDNREDAGYFVFARSGGSTGGAPSVDTFNPAVLGSSTSATVGATATMNQAFNYAFQHSSDHMNIPYLERISMRDRNKYALSITGDATDMGRFSPLYQPSQEEASVWVKPYATFETVGLKNGPKVHNNTYGTLIGFDTEMQSIKRGWDRVFTGYIGYNGASQRYSGIDSTQNGGLLGGTMTLYKGNFFNATTVSVGASVANNQTMYGNEDFAMLLSGIGNKTGYNFEFKEGKLILQPSMLMSYTFVNTFDYTNAAGVRIDNKPLHALQLAPGVKVIGNLKNGWQPYASVQMVWNLMGESNATANGVKLPEMSIKPYVQYGVGVQKRIKDHFTAYGQAMVQNGGRNGVSLTAGFRWALGHDNCKYKVEDKQLRGKADKQLRSDAAKSKRHYEERSDVVISSNNAIATPSARNDNGRKILKQMTPQQRAAYGGKYYNTTRTAKSGSLRQY